MQCIAQLSHAAQTAAYEADLDAADAPVNERGAGSLPDDMTDPMADAETGRQMQAAKCKKSMKQYHVERKKKAQLRAGPITKRVCAVRFPRRPGQHEDFIQVKCLMQAGKQRPRGVWIHADDVPWLSDYAAEEVASADGVAFAPPGESDRAGGAPEMFYDDTGSQWIYSCLDPRTQTLHKLTKKVVKWLHRAGRFVKAQPEEVATQKEKARLLLLNDARTRGLSVNFGEAGADSDGNS